MVQLLAIQKAKESFLRQKSQQQLVNCGDSNSRFFYSMVKTRQAKNTIKQLVTETGTIVEDIEEIGHEAVEFYKKLLGTQDTKLKRVTVDTLRKMLKFHLEEDSVNLCAMVTTDEIREVVMGIKKGKAPGPDRYSAQFFQEH
ncbi:unnamed protein product [Linum trigynum]|uniref:Uncharacterized protein n=1 Tax=Linum trigynum TaxID=586398 RepID=A0AAV2D6U2_9ROSI